MSFPECQAAAPSDRLYYSSLSLPQISAPWARSLLLEQKFCYPLLLNLASNLSHLIGKLIVPPLLLLSLLRDASSWDNIPELEEPEKPCWCHLHSHREASVSVTASPGLCAWAPAWPPPSHHHSQVSGGLVPSSSSAKSGTCSERNGEEVRKNPQQKLALNVASVQHQNLGMEVVLY